MLKFINDKCNMEQFFSKMTIIMNCKQQCISGHAYVWWDKRKWEDSYIFSWKMFGERIFGDAVRDAYGKSEQNDKTAWMMDSTWSLLLLFSFFLIQKLKSFFSAFEEKIRKEEWFLFKIIILSLFIFVLFIVARIKNI